MVIVKDNVEIGCNNSIDRGCISKINLTHERIYFSFNYYNCTVSNNSYSNSISTTNSEILIDNINLSSGNCFYINSKSGYGNIAGPFLLSNFIFCF